MQDYRLGIDVGGTNTDAVILDTDDEPIVQTKTPTTEDITTGIVNALDDVIENSAVSVDDLGYVMLGTTHATNAITERRGLNEVGVLRFGAPATQSINPLLEWPDDLADAIGNNYRILDGGHEFDGRELNDLDEDQIREAAHDFADVDAFAISSVFSPVRSDHEERAAEIVREVVGDEIPISVSNEIGSVGLLERENATVMNAALTNVAADAANAFIDAMAERSIDADLYFGQNDGTLMSVEYALEYPIFTVASGPSNSVRGAAYLSGIQNGIIVDVGGTTTDVGAITDGFPRESSVAVEIGEVKTNFRMPDLLSIGLGGGSKVTVDGEEVSVGPESVGYRLPEEGLVFGGETLTTTDLAVAAGNADIGDVTPDVDPGTVEAGQAAIQSRVERAVDRMKTSAEPVPVVIVGGGSILIADGIDGASDVYRPDHYEVANAVGVAIAQVSGEVDRIYSLDDIQRDEAMADAKQQATEDAIEAGADGETVDIVDVEEIPLSYLPGNATRIKVKAAGELAY